MKIIEKSMKIIDKSMEIIKNQCKFMVFIDILWQSMVEQPTRAVSRGLVSGVNMPTVFPNDARPVQEAGAAPFAHNSLQAPPVADCKKKVHDLLWFLSIKKKQNYIHVSLSTKI